MKPTQTIQAKYVKDTKRKHRYSAESGPISIGIYIEKGSEIPEEITIRLKKEES
jgi:hypothetical protein